MRRPLLPVGLAYLLAAAASFAVLPENPLPLCVCLGVAAALLGRSGKGKGTRLAGLLLFAVSAALAAFSLFYQRNILPLEGLEGRTVELTGLVTEVQDYAGGHYYTVTAAFPDDPDLPKNRSVRLYSWQVQSCAPGDMIRCQADFTKGEVEISVFQRSKGIFAQGRILDEVRPADGPGREISRFFINLRGWMAANIERRVRARPEVVSAMTLALRQDVDNAVSRSLQRTGISHLLALSGLHLSILTGMVRGFLRRMLRSKILVNGIGIVFVVFFTALVGFAPSIARAAVMWITLLLGEMLSRKSDSLNSLGLACLVIGIFRPYWALGTGLWLSVSSTLGILLFGERVSRWMHRKLRTEGTEKRKAADWFVGPVSMTVSAYACSMPVLLAGFGSIPLISPVANLLVSPLVPVIIGGGLIQAVVPEGTLLEPALLVLGSLMSACTGILIDIADILSQTLIGSFTLASRWSVVWLSGALLLALILWRRKTDGKRRGLAAMLMLAVFFLGNLLSGLMSERAVELIAFQGSDSILLIRGGRAVVVGAPDSYSGGAIIQYLDYRNVRGIDAVILTDEQQRVTSGMTELSKAYQIGCVLGSGSAVILGQMEQAAGSPGMSLEGGASVLGGVMIGKAGPKAMKISAGGCSALKVDGECDIMVGETENQVTIFKEGVVVLPARMSREIRLTEESRYKNTVVRLLLG